MIYQHQEVQRLMASQILVEESMPSFGVGKVFKIVENGISSTQQVAQILCCGPHHLMIVPSILAHYLERFADSLPTPRACRQ